MCFKNSTASDGPAWSEARASDLEVGIVRNTSSREGLSTPVCFRKCPNKGSSNTRVSDRCAKLYIVAVLPFLGPAHNATVRAMPYATRFFRRSTNSAANHPAGT